MFSFFVSFSITDVIHDVGEIRTNLLIESTQIPCACFRCSDQNQFKSLTFKQYVLFMKIIHEIIFLFLFLDLVHVLH